MNRLLSHVGNVRGSLANKDNRAARLIARWDELKEKFEGMVERGQGKTKQARLAYAVLVMMETGVRVGNEDSAEGYQKVRTEFVKVKGKMTPVKHHVDGKYVPNPKFVGVTPRYVRIEGEWVKTDEVPAETVRTFGLTTLQHRHVRKVRNGGYALDFIGKKGVKQLFVVRDMVLLKYRPAKDKPGKVWLGVTCNELLKFVRKSVGRKFCAKDFRTAKVNMLFCERFKADYGQAFKEAETKTAKKKVVKSVIEDTAFRIGHTPGVCKSSYLSKGILNFLAL